MISTEDAKPAVGGAGVAVAASFGVNPTLAVGLGALAAIAVKSVTETNANFLLVGGLMFVLVGLGGSALQTLPGGGVVALAGLVGGLAGVISLWLGRKMRQSALGRIFRIIYTIINFKATLLVILKVGIVLPATFAAGVLGAEVPIIGEAAFVLYCFAVLAGFYAIDQGKSLFQVRRKLRPSRRARPEDLKTAASAAEATAQKAESAGATLRDMEDTDDVKQAVSSAKESVDSVTGGDGGEDEVSGSGETAADSGEATTDSGETAPDSSDAAGGDSSDAAGGDSSDAAVPAASDAETDPTAAGSASGRSEPDSVGTDWLAETTLAVKNAAPEPKSVRVGCRVDGERKLVDDAELSPDERSEWTGVPNDSAFEIGVIVENGPSSGKRFSADGSPHGEIGVVITDSDVEFTDSLDAGSSRDETASTDRTASDSAGGGDSAGRGDSAGVNDSAGATGDSSASDEDDFWADFESSGATTAASGGATAGATLESETAESDGGESWASAAELAAAVRDSPSAERVERLAGFLDASEPVDRLDAVTGLRQWVDEYPEAVVTAVPSLADLLDDEDAKARQEAMATLQRLANTHPDAVASATAACIERLDDEDPKVRTMACRVLGAVNATRATERLEALSNDDPHKGVQVAALQAVQALDG